MIIKKMCLNNFRQFYGPQELDLISTDPEKNVTVIYGENGRGKTGLYRALMFCLYGIKTLYQDSGENEKKIFLVNKKAMDEASEKGKDEVQAFVEIEFAHMGKKYKLKRNLLGIKKGDDEFEQLAGGSLHVTGEDGDTKPIEELDKIEEEINLVLDKRVREYFLFDGEKIERLTRISREQKKEIEIGIRNLLQIDRLDTAIHGLNGYLKNIRKQLQNKSKGEFKKVSMELESKEDEKEWLKNEINNTQNEMEKAEFELKEFDKKLKEFEVIRELVNRRDILDTRIRDLKGEREEKLAEMKRMNSNIGLLLLEPEIKYVEKLIGTKMDHHEIPSQIRETLVSRILHEMKCVVCNRPIESGTDTLDFVLKWKDKLLDSKVEDELLETYKEISGSKEFIRMAADEVDGILRDFYGKTEKIENLEQTLKAISDEIGEGGKGKDIRGLEKSRDATIKKLGQLMGKLENYSEEEKGLNEEIKILTTKMQELAKKEGIKNELIEKQELAEASKNALEKIYKEFADEIKEKISDIATELFHNLIDEDGKETFKRIKVMDDYSLQLYDWRGKPFLANISAGQRQITSIAFITSLAKLAGGRDILEVPLFMDTPFGRLSGEHRDKLISYLPKLSKQWILLATDTEFSAEEANRLSATGKWGKVYVLESNRPYVTIIREKDVETFRPARKTRMIKGS